jgi:mono/diheme cytochrome c family protein
MEAAGGRLRFRQPSSSAYSVLLLQADRRHCVSLIEMLVQKKENAAGRACARTLAIMTLCAASSPIATVSAQDKAKIETGENVYNTNCQICHGEQLANTGQTFDLRRLKDNERTRFDNSVRNGKNQMPPWKGVLTDEEIDQLWHYIRANAFQK